LSNSVANVGWTSNLLLRRHVAMSRAGFANKEIGNTERQVKSGVT